MRKSIPVARLEHKDVPLLFELVAGFLRYPLQSIAVRGDTRILRRKKLALFSSRKCPGEIILKTFDLARHLRDHGVTVVSGFHSPMEREVLRILLRGKQPVVWCRARSIDNMRIAKDWKPALEEGRLLFLSPFREKENRVTRARAAIRNRLVAALAGDLFFTYASPGGETEKLAKEALQSTRDRKRIFTLESEYNEPLIRLGAKPVTAESFTL